jgi:hypothetical protein
MRCPGQGYDISADVCKHRRERKDSRCEKCHYRERVEEKEVKSKINAFLDQIRERNKNV